MMDVGSKQDDYSRNSKDCWGLDRNDRVALAWLDEKGVVSFVRVCVSKARRYIPWK